MSSKMKRTLWIIGIVILVLVVGFGVGYLILRPKPLKPPETVSSLAELESSLEDLTGHNPDSPPGLSLVVKEGEIVYQMWFLLPTAVADPGLLPICACIRTANWA
jgi:hypothetical protein